MVPARAVLDVAAVFDAADEFARSGLRPTCVQWVNYLDALHATWSSH